MFWMTHGEFVVVLGVLEMMLLAMIYFWPGK
jgi:hypothetical protein